MRHSKGLTTINTDYVNLFSFTHKISYSAVFTLPLKESTLWPLFVISELPTPLLLNFGVIIKENKSDLDTGTVVPPQLI